MVVTRRELLIGLTTCGFVSTLHAQPKKRPAPTLATVTLIVDGMT